jgi:hypothetical protein
MEKVQGTLLDVAALCESNQISVEGTLNNVVLEFVSSALPSREDKLLMLSYFSDLSKLYKAGEDSPVFLSVQCGKQS